MRDGGVVPVAPLPGPGVDLVVWPGDEHAYVQHGSPDDEVALSTVDLATGETKFYEDYDGFLEGREEYKAYCETSDRC